MGEIATDEEWAELEKGLEGVTPGPWRQGKTLIHEVYHDYRSGHLGTFEEPKDAAYIARLTPDAIRRLIASYRAMQSRAEAAESRAADLERLANSVRERAAKMAESLAPEPTNTRCVEDILQEVAETGMAMAIAAAIRALPIEHHQGEGDKA